MDLLITSIQHSFSLAFDTPLCIHGVISLLIHPFLGFISTSWRITSNGMFAGTCIGVILLVMSLEFLRRLMREYDAYVLRQNIKNRREAALALSQESSSCCSEETEKAGASATLRAIGSRRTSNNTLFQRQIIRAVLHMVTFGVAYLVMLLAMYYNVSLQLSIACEKVVLMISCQGYIIFSILIGAFLGAFMFSWDQLDKGCDEGDNSDVTMCCG